MKTEDLNFPKKKQQELMWFSTFLFVLSALLIRIALSIQNMVLMKFFHIKFYFALFGNIVENGGRGNWTDSRVILAYGLGPILSFVIGIYLYHVLKKNKSINWKARLLLTWFAFILIHLLPMGMLAGVFIYDDFGYAFANIFMAKIIRMGLSIVAISICIYFRSIWIELFLKTSSGHRILFDRKQFLKRNFIYPWLIGTLILTCFAIVGQYWSWSLKIILLGLVILPIFNSSRLKIKLRLTKSNNKHIFKNRLSIFAFTLTIVLLFFLSFVKIPM